jgi:GNAT superfamily N-acetyltransferase
MRRPLPEIENIQVRMDRPHLRDVPHYDMPAGSRMRTMVPEEAPLWTEVQREAEWLSTVQNEFSSDLPAISQRCFLLVEDGGRAVGTISSWYSENYKGTGQNWGRIHWVAIRPSHQGTGLARPMLSYAMEKLVEWGHPAAWLATSTARIPALKLYLDFGFVPDLEPAGAREAWEKVRAVLPHAALEAVL